MPIEFRCTACNKLLRVPDGSAGKQAKCPDCQTVLNIPDPTQAPPSLPPSQPASESASPFGAPPPPPLDSDNPFVSPRASQSSFDPITDQQAAAKLSAPATCLIVAGGIGIPIHLLNLAMAFFMDAAALGGDFQPDNPVPGLEFLNSPGFTVGTSLIGIARCVLIIFGALQMKKLGSYSFALTTAIIAIVPCFAGCCLLDLPFGIWATVILCQSDVKLAFDRATRTF